MARNGMQYGTTAKGNSTALKKVDYSASAYVIKKTQEAKETLTKFPPPYVTKKK